MEIWVVRTSAEDLILFEGTESACNQYIEEYDLHDECYIYLEIL